MSFSFYLFFFKALVDFVALEFLSTVDRKHFAIMRHRNQSLINKCNYLLITKYGGEIFVYEKCMIQIQK